MRIVVLSVITGIVLAVPSFNSYAASSSAASVPADVIQAVQKSYPDATILAASASCQLGAEKWDAFGLLTKINKGQDLRALVAFKKDQSWHLQEVPKDLKSPKGESPDFLREFQPFEIHCVSLPHADPAISTEANGAFVGAFAKKHDPQAKHLCFEADDTYNNWACLTINPATARPELSFVQINAD